MALKHVKIPINHPTLSIEQNIETCSLFSSVVSFNDQSKLKIGETKGYILGLQSSEYLRNFVQRPVPCHLNA